jgi:lipoprotein NlpI
MRPSDTTPIPPRASAVPATVFLIVALAPYGMLVRGGLGQGGAILLWLLLGAMLLLGGARGDMPRWAALAWCAMLPLSGVAAYFDVGMLASPAARWALIVMPPLLVATAFWAHFPRLHLVAPDSAVNAAMLLAVLALSVGPAAQALAPVIVPPPPAPPASPPVVEATPPPAAAPADFAGRLAQLTPDSPLADYLPYLSASGDLKRDALERARLLTNRQQDAETLLAKGSLRGLEDLWRLDLAPSQALCQVFGAQLRLEAERDRGREGYWAVSDGLEIHLETMNWLTANGCDLSAPLEEVTRTAAGYPSSPESARFLAAIAALSTPWPPSPPADPARCVGPGDAPAEQRIADCTAIIRTGRAGFTRLSAALTSRGNAYVALKSYDRAVADYSAAIRLLPDDRQGWARLLNNRANAYDAAGDGEAARQDYDTAIRLDPGYATAFNNRGVAAEAAGAHDRAIADFDQAVRLDPTYATAFANRGRARYFQAKYADALRDFDQAQKLRPEDAYNLLWRSLAQRRVRRNATPAEMLAAAGALDRAAWPWPLVSVYLGEHDVAWGQEAALSGEAAAQMRQSCEASFYLGEKLLVDGAAAPARGLLQQAATGCPPRSVAGAGAAAELARLGR